MDPKACLDRAEGALAEGDLEECREALQDYRTWRTKGGFEPSGGDVLYYQIQARFRKIREAAK